MTIDGIKLKKHLEQLRGMSGSRVLEELKNGIETGKYEINSKLKNNRVLKPENTEILHRLITINNKIERLAIELNKLDKTKKQLDNEKNNTYNRKSGDVINANERNEEKLLNPDYYKFSRMECIDAIEGLELGFYEGVILQYIARWRQKNGIVDLKKARWYLNRLIEDKETE